MTQGIEFFRPKTKQPQEEVRVCGYYRQHDFFLALTKPHVTQRHAPILTSKPPNH